MKNKKKPIIIISLITIIFLVGLILIFHKEEKIELKQESFIFEYGDDIINDVSYYLKDADSTKNIKDYKLINNLKKNSETGLIEPDEYTITIKYKKQEETFKVIIKDTKAPIFTKYKDKISLIQDSEDVDLTKYFIAEDLSDVILSVEGSFDISKVGEYNLKMIATDKSGNKTIKDFVVEVKEKEKIPSTPPVSSNNKSTSNTNSSDNSKDVPKIVERYRKDISDNYVRQINEYRKSKGLDELPVTTEAQTEADRRAKEIVDNYSHDGSGYGFGENIGDGSIGSDFFTAWKNSPTHNATMLREQNRAIAVSVYEANNKWYAVAVFRMNY